MRTSVHVLVAAVVAGALSASSVGADDGKPIPYREAAVLDIVASGPPTWPHLGGSLPVAGTLPENTPLLPLAQLVGGPRLFTEGLVEVEPRDLVLRRLHYSATAAPLRVAALVADDPAVLLAPPPLPPGQWSAAVRVHEAFVQRLAPLLVGGRTLSSAQLDGHVAPRLGPLGQNGQPPSDRTPWSLTLDKRRPLRASFAEHTMALTFRLTEFTRGEDRYEMPLDVTVRYRLQSSDGRACAVRQGGVEVAPPADGAGGSPRLSLRQAAESRVLMRRLERALLVEIAFGGVLPTGESELPDTPAPVSVDCVDGWLVIAWR